VNTIGAGPIYTDESLVFLEMGATSARNVALLILGRDLVMSSFRQEVATALPIQGVLWVIAIVV